MPSIFIRSILFLSSYFPLVLIFCVLLWGEKPWWVVGTLLALGIASLLVLWLYFQRARHRMYVEQKKVTRVERRDTEVMSYIATYLIPFLSFTLNTWQQVTALVLFIVVLMVVYVHSNMIYINPVLNIVGYRLHEVEVENGTQAHFYIARKRVVPNENIRFVRLSDDIYLEK